jgi:hypothetical protein
LPAPSKKGGAVLTELIEEDEDRLSENTDTMAFAPANPSNRTDSFEQTSQKFFNPESENEEAD